MRPQIQWDDDEEAESVDAVTAVNVWEIEPARGYRKGENDSDGEEEDAHIARNARLVHLLEDIGGSSEPRRSACKEATGLDILLTSG